MPVRYGRVVELTVEAGMGRVSIQRPGAPSSDSYHLYKDDEAEAISQSGMLHRSALLALLGRAMSDPVIFVAVYPSDADPTTAQRVSLVDAMGEDSDAPTKELLMEILGIVKNPIKLPPVG